MVKDILACLDWCQLTLCDNAGFIMNVSLFGTVLLGTPEIHLLKWSRWWKACHTYCAGLADSEQNFKESMDCHQSRTCKKMLLIVALYERCFCLIPVKWDNRDYLIHYIRSWFWIWSVKLVLFTLKSANLYLENLCVGFWLGSMLFNMAEVNILGYMFYCPVHRQTSDKLILIAVVRFFWLQLLTTCPLTVSLS